MNHAEAKAFIQKLRDLVKKAGIAYYTVTEEEESSGNQNFVKLQISIKTDRR